MQSRDKIFNNKGQRLLSKGDREAGLVVLKVGQMCKVVGKLGI